MISDWVVVEFASARSIKVRMTHLNVSDRATVVNLFTVMRKESLAVAPVIPTLDTGLAGAATSLGVIAELV